MSGWRKTVLIPLVRFHLSNPDRLASEPVPSYVKTAEARITERETEILGEVLKAAEAMRAENPRWEYNQVWILEAIREARHS